MDPENRGVKVSAHPARLLITGSRTRPASPSSIVKPPSGGVFLGCSGSDTPRIDRNEIRRKFRHECFSCDTAIGKDNEAFDHTLPARLLWPMTTENATLLCTTCNGQKSARWPSEFYDEQHLRKLAVLTAIPYELLIGRANPKRRSRCDDTKQTPIPSLQRGSIARRN